MSDAAGALPPPGDRSALERLARFGGPTLVQQMIALFLEEAPRRIARARDALDGGDWPTVQQVAHSLKSSCAQMGALAMRDLSRQIESSTDRDAAAGWLAQLPAELDRYVAWLGEATGADGA